VRRDGRVWTNEKMTALAIGNLFSPRDDSNMHVCARKE